MVHWVRWTKAGILLAVLVAPPVMGEDSAPTEPLDWMAGHWCTDSGGKSVEELWLPPRGEVLVGLGRTYTTNRTVGFEFLRIADVDGVQNYSAQPGGRPPTHFARTDGGEDWVRFENPEHDFPQRLEYRRDGDKLLAEVAGPGNNGDEAVIRLGFRACEASASNNAKADADADAIKAARAASNQAIARHDTDAIVSFFDEEYVITTGAGSIEPGRDAQLGMWAEHFDQLPDVVYVRTPTDVTLSEANSRAIENGAWVGTWTSENSPQEKGGRYTAYWRKVDGVWKIRSELFVTLYCEGVDC
jgi:ketosteroid isomerase-like protein